ncbi:hypothetical protein Purlil1_9483 [Purpureocillium lilacinum]|uniref:Uncharacterized protein n=1 Tax=Purpureocillium lilacinum TaxID=33203 RepID=A0ABR0BQ76_PURLI|nr:hypothetical protein Purlil1_9483 [Purpureocillium lilacinum]
MLSENRLLDAAWLRKAARSAKGRDTLGNIKVKRPNAMHQMGRYVPWLLALSCRGKSNAVVSLTAMFICLIHHHPHPPNRPVYRPFSPPSSLATATQHTQRMTACCGVHDADSATMVLVERAQTLLMNAWPVVDSNSLLRFSGVTDSTRLDSTRLGT